MTNDPAKPPFGDHRRYYLFLKIVVLVIVVLLALRYLLSQPFAP